MNLRKVLFNKWIPVQFDKVTRRRIKGTGQYSNEWTDGKFHEWGQNHEDYGDNVGNYPVGIIEDGNGYMHEIITAHIQFIK